VNNDEKNEQYVSWDSSVGNIEYEVDMCESKSPIGRYFSLEIWITPFCIYDFIANMNVLP
jgi:hypothetical protein